MRPARREREKGFMQAIIDLARVYQWMVYHPFDSRHSASGWPDLVLAKAPTLIFAELKTARGTRGEPTDAQRLWLDTLAQCGGEVHVWRPSDWDTIVERLKPPR